ncbi:hypothetical protein [Methanobrevibacter sp.]|uniref:hypothetical protein n=1 Tax=Methanobrevibacter sp. TaxID=66852 RepID=UPI00386CECAE
MKFKKGLIFICLIICLFSIANVCASDINDTSVISEDGSSIEDSNILSEGYDEVIETIDKNNNEELSIEPNSNNITEEDKLLINDEFSNNELGNIYTEDNVEIMIADEVVGNAYGIRISIPKNLVGTLNVYVDDSLKWTKEISSNANGYGTVLYPKDLGMNKGSKYLVKVTFGKYSYQCTSYWTLDPDPTLDDLADLIKRFNTISLTKSYSYVYDDSNKNGIVIDKDLVINGNGHYLDSYGNRILYIKSGINVTLSNIIFKNGYKDYGGAIYIGKSNVKIINCTFINNRAEKKGGAIYSGSVNSLYMDKIIFKNNDFKDDIGLINVVGKKIIINNFELQDTDPAYNYDNAFIIRANNITISNSTLKPIKKTTRYNKLFLLDGDKITIDSCNFTNNINCIFLETDYENLRTIIKNCYFNNNEGFLINFDYYNPCYLLLFNSTFENNDEQEIIHWNCYNGEINSCTFLENSNFYKLIKIHDYIPKLINNTGLGTSTNVSLEKVKIYLQEDKLNLFLKDSMGNKLSFKKIKVIIGNNYFEEYTDYKGSVCLDVSNIPEGNYDSVIYFEGDMDYDCSSIKEILTFKVKTDTLMNIKNISSYQFDNLFEGVLTSYNGYQISNAIISINCNEEVFYAITDNNGKFSLVLNLTPGNYTINSYYNGNNLYDSIQITSMISVYSSIIMDNSISEYNTNLKLKTKFLDKSGNRLQYQYVLFKIDNEDTVLITDNNGDVTFNKQVSGGLHELKVVNPLTKEEITRIIFVKKATPKITAAQKNFEPTVKTKKYSITLKNNQNKAMKNTKVSIKVNGKTYTATTKSNGVATFNLKKLTKKGTYKAVITYKGNKNYNKITKTVTITVKPTPKITAKAVTFKKSLKTKKYTITLKDNKNKVMKKTKVSLKVNGKTYKVATNAKGKATFKITKLTKKGTYKAVVSFAGNKNFNKATKNVNIKVK